MSILEHQVSRGYTHDQVVGHLPSVAYHTSRNRVSDTITHVTLNTINGVVTIKGCAKKMV
jgi:hypothetical protein